MFFLLIFSLISCVYPVLGQFGCNSPSCMTHTLSCPVGQVLSIRDATYFSRPGGCPDTCDQSTCCTYKSGDKMGDKLDAATLEYIRQECTAKEKCSFTLAQKPGFVYIFYNKVCVPESQVLSLLCKDSVTTKFKSYMFYHGRYRSDTKAVTCSCSIDAPSGQLSVRTEYINLHSSTCPSFASSLPTLSLPSCDANGLQKPFQNIGTVSVPLTLNVNNLITRASDVFWVEFRGGGTEQITVTCTGCGVNVAGACGRTEHVYTGCYGAAACNTHTMTCKPGKKIAVTSRVYRGRKANSASCTPASCNTVQSCCSYEVNDPRQTLSQVEREAIHKSCDGKETCDFTPDISNPQLFTFAYYGYDCIPDTSFIDIINGGSLSGFTELFMVYDGKSRTASTSATCSCDITSASYPIQVSIYRMTLHPDSCCQFKMTSSGETLPAACTEADGAKVLGSQISSTSSVTIDLDKMIARQDDYLMVRIGSASGVDASCGGCFQQPITEDATNVCQFPKTDTTPSIDDTATGASTGNENGGETEDNIVAIAAGTIGGILLLGLIIFAVRRIVRKKKTDPLNF